MKYKIVCYNTVPVEDHDFGLFKRVKPRTTDVCHVSINASNEEEAIQKAQDLVDREEYKVEEVSDEDGKEVPEDE